MEDIFSTRMGFKESNMSESVLLDYFLESLLPTLADQVKSLYPLPIQHRSCTQISYAVESFSKHLRILQRNKIDQEDE